MRIFINYSEEDKRELNGLTQLLLDAEYEPWSDIRLLPGQDKANVVRENIIQCDVFVYLLSPESVGSQWCKWALSLAVHSKRPIIPVIVRKNTSIPDELQNLETADFTEGTEVNNVVRLLAGINQNMYVSPSDIPLLSEPSGTPPQLAPIVYAGFFAEDAERAQKIIDDIQLQLSGVSILPVEEMLWGQKSEDAIATLVFLSEGAKIAARRAIQPLIDTDHIIPVVLSGEEDKPIPHNLAGVPYCDLRDEAPINGLSDLVSSIRKVLRETVYGRRSTLEERYWGTMIRRLERGSCIPIIGPDMCGELFPSEQAVVKAWITQYGYAVEGEPELARVAQYLAYAEFSDKREIKSQLIEHRKLNGNADFVEADDNPYRILARLPIKVFLTTGHDNFLYQALKAEGKEPTEVKDWSIEDVKSEEVDFTTFTVEKPAVVYLLGHYADEGSITVFEDDFMDFVYKIGKQDLRLPTSLERLLKNNLLLLVGFRVHDWSFRIMAQMLADYLNPMHDIRHVAVQMAPLKDESSDKEREKVERYVKAYLNSRNSEVYISDTATFLEELQQKWEARTQ